MIIDRKNTACFGVAGNFTGHLEQAGEAKDFVNVVTAEENAPKAIFPTYIPETVDKVRAVNRTESPNTETGDKVEAMELEKALKAVNGAEPPESERALNTVNNTESLLPGGQLRDTVCPSFLHIFPFDSERIIYPTNQDKLQIEPECAIIFKADWEDGRLVSLSPVCFGASNDCSIRREGARKISLKKNWGKCSKGFSANPIELESFDEKSRLADYRIASFMVRDGEVFDYGIDSAVKDYSYVFGKLNDWMLDKFNHQEDAGPAENIGLYLNEAGCPKHILVSIGATRYTDFGEKNYLKRGDRAVVILYPESRYTHEKIRKMVAEKKYDAKDVSVLDQVVEEELLARRTTALVGHVDLPDSEEKF